MAPRAPIRTLESREKRNEAHKKLKAEKRRRQDQLHLPDTTGTTIYKGEVQHDHREAARLTNDRYRRRPQLTAHVGQLGPGDHGDDPGDAAVDDDWTDIEEMDYGDNFNEGDYMKREPMEDLGQLVEGAYTAQKTKRNRKGEYTLAQETNARNIDRILPYLAKALAKNRMVHCNCAPDMIDVVQVVCIDLLSCNIRYFDKCRCLHWTCRLIPKGLFPTKANPRVAISLDTLELFQSVSSHGAFAKSGFAHGLKDFHRMKLRHETLSRYDEIFRVAVPFYLRAKRARDDFLNKALNSFFRRRAGVGLFAPNPAEATNPTDPPQPTPHKPIELGTLMAQCPVCFYRPDPLDRSPVIICIDGNMQHSRYKHVAKANYYQHYDEKLFFEVDLDLRERVDISLPSVAGTICEHNFKATSKPTTMTFKDETGLLMIVCRHDMPLRFLNIYAGERLGWVVYIIEEFIKILDEELDNIDDDQNDEVLPDENRIPVILLYDIACQLSPYIRKRHPRLFKRLVVAVNKFHGYAHEFRCQELFGQHQTMNIGESDGEGTERVWSLLRSLVVSGRISSAPNRVLFIETLAFAIMHRKRMQMGHTFWLRYKRLHSKLRRSKRELANLIGVEVRDGFGNVAEISEVLLEAERKKQRIYFTATPPLISHPHLGTYEAILNEENLKEAVELVHDTYFDIDEEDEITKRQYDKDLQQAKNQLNAATIKVEGLLQKNNQERIEWRVGGERRALAERLSKGEHKVYRALLVEKRARKAVEDKLGAESESEKKELQKKETELAKAMATTDRELATIQSTRADWVEGGPKWNNELHYEKLTELQIVYNSLLRDAASRALHLRNVKAHSIGGKPAAKLMDGIHKKHSQMSKEIKKFNDIISVLPAKYAPHKLTLAAFKGTDDEAPGFKADKARDALFHLHILKSELLGTLDGPRAYWISSEQVRVGIVHLLRVKRGEEELELMKVEWRRFVEYTKRLLEGLLEFVMNTPEPDKCILGSVYRILWDEVLAGERIVTASKSMADKFGPNVFPEDGMEWLVKRVKTNIHAHYRHERDFLRVMGVDASGNPRVDRPPPNQPAPVQQVQPVRMDLDQHERPAPVQPAPMVPDEPQQQQPADALGNDNQLQQQPEPLYEPPKYLDIVKPEDLEFFKDEMFPDDEPDDLAGDLEAMNGDSDGEDGNPRGIPNVLGALEENSERLGLVENVGSDSIDKDPFGLIERMKSVALDE